MVRARDAFCEVPVIAIVLVPEGVAPILAADFPLLHPASITTTATDSAHVVPMPRIRMVDIEILSNRPSNSSKPKASDQQSTAIKGRAGKRENFGGTLRKRRVAEVSGLMIPVV
jgi:hypothetical protein